ncbi:endoplasmic reticulum-Golgi intermediate compartment protein 1-like [Symsagittifera roscoffensis]|uniref:endoplasmic reticulum-Golgi intermediate compartment protein 1-like n=1 Tax=Symsagittifera roscoffensis TaxID=84072 RepID=UPI00307B2249
MQFDIRRFDIYRKVPKDLTQPTYIGACISVSSMALIAFLFTSELIAFLSPEIESVLYVDDPGEQEQIPVFLDISLPELHCDVLGIDIQDEMGRHEVGNFENMKKLKLGPDGRGCRLEASFKINKVSGNFHVSTHARSQQAGKNVNFKHQLHNLIFGESILSNISKHYGLKDTSFTPLNGLDHTKGTFSGKETFEYHLKIVPTVYSHGQGTNSELHGYQFTALKKIFETNAHGMRIMPAIWFKYQLTPITVKYALRAKPFYHFLTTVCAIVGGTFTVAGIIDSCLFTAHEVFKKIEMGKLS